MLSSMRSTKLALLAVLCLGSASAAAGTVYKLVDKHGNVAYAASVPKDFDGYAVQLEIDTSTNTVTSLPAARPASGPGGETEIEKILRRRPPSNDDQIQAAQLRVEAAQKAFENARDSSTPDDWIYLGNRMGVGLRRAPKPEYEERLVALEQATKQAEEDLKKVERGL